MTSLGIALVALATATLALAVASGALRVDTTPAVPDAVPGPADPASVESILPAASLPAAMSGTWTATQPADMSFGTPSGPERLLLEVTGDLVVRSTATQAEALIGSSATTDGVGLPLVLLADGRRPTPEWLGLAIDSVPVAWCDAGDRGEYAWVLRRAGEDGGPTVDTLELTLIRDECDARARTLPRTWVRALDRPGQGGSGVIPVSRSSVRVTLPKGEYVVEGNDSGILTRSADGSTGLGVWVDPLPLLDPCSPLGGTAPAWSTPAAFLASLGENPALAVSSTRDVDIGGLPATEVVLSQPETLECTGPDGSPVPADAVYAWQSGPFWTLPRADRTRVYLVQVPQHLLVIVPLGPDEATRDAIRDSLSVASTLETFATP